MLKGMFKACGDVLTLWDLRCLTSSPWLAIVGSLAAIVRLFY
jgi:hypothetical protein